MAAIRGRGNKATELRMMALLREAGIHGWRRHLPLPGRPDFAFPSLRLAIFVDGCFWHACPKHFRMPKNARAFWEKKISQNRQRDLSANRALRRKGWVVARVWEHALLPRQVSRTMARIRRLHEKRMEHFR